MDLSTYFGHMDNLKNDIFSTGPPSGGSDGDGKRGCNNSSMEIREGLNL